MANEEKETTNIDETAAKLAQDIVALNKKTRQIKLPSDLREIDLAALAPPATTDLLKSAFTRLSTESARVRQEREAQVDEEARALEESIDARRQAMTQKMTELEKAEAEAGDTARVARLRMDVEVKRYQQRVFELQMDKTVKSGRVEIRPSAVKAEVAPVTPAASAGEAAPVPSDAAAAGAATAPPAPPAKKVAKKTTRKPPAG